VLVDGLGAPQRTHWLRRRAYELMAAAGVRKVRFYDARHSTLTFMATNGVPDVIGPRGPDMRICRWRNVSIRTRQGI
jgi:integrase